MTALKSIFDLLHTYGLEAFKIASSGSSRSGSPADSANEEEGAEDGVGAQQQDKNAANSVLSILTRLLDNEVGHRP